MNFIESFYRLFIFIASYQCCLGTPHCIRSFEIALQSIDIVGVAGTFTNDVKVRKFDSTAESCRFEVLFPQAKDVTSGPFTPAGAEITFLYKKRIVFGVYNGINSFTVYGLSFQSESSLQLFFSSLRYYQPQPQSYSLTNAILRYQRNLPNSIHVMAQGCEFHIQGFQIPGFNWKSFNFTRLTADNDGTRQGILIFAPQTFSVSKPLGKTIFAVCLNVIPDEVFIVIFANPSSGTRFFNAAKTMQDPEKANSCEFPNLIDAQRDYLANLKEGPQEVIESIVLE